MKKTNHNLITIGELSMLTDVNIKSLRYYEKIGVLRPAYVDPDTAYRYYTYSQISIVYSIQFFVKMDIPLSELHRFINKKDGTINFKDQISSGIFAAVRKMESIQNQIDHAEFLISEIDRSERIFNASAPIRDTLPEKTCLALPVRGVLTEQKYHSVLKQLLMSIKKSGIIRGSETGVLHFGYDSADKSFVFADVRVLDGSGESIAHIIHIPAQTYLSAKSAFIDINAKNL